MFTAAVATIPTVAIAQSPDPAWGVVLEEARRRTVC
jgi:hypothetical protein